ncbi:fungal specific transcription factor [Colletotrichum plurivorum]|uniref:Fungal specific transcription factor n=1 Tax=Colletotrichum plurivorum TaxID=2175906 RepID=A0A8H6JJ43_9PEZI|nr:fungal specific transcription factor [Colletotrichum plurivorum]
MSAMSSSEPKADGKKRQRVSLACLACRRRRMRCDGQQPVCGSCTKRGTQCEFQHSENKRRSVHATPASRYVTDRNRPPSKKYVESLQARIRHLEAQVVSLGSQPSTTIPVSGEDAGADDPEQGDSTGEDEQDPLSELAGMVGRLNVIDDGQLHYFGSQSCYNLVREPLQPVATHDPTLRLQRQGIAAASRLGLHTPAAVPDELREHLLELYWRWQNPWNYVIHKGAFLRSLRGEDEGKYCSPLLLSSVFAIAARYSDHPELRSDPDDPSTAGDAFCEHAKILLLYESEAPTITTVQAACLLALRIMSDGKEALGWLYSGNATRMAHNLGLNLDCSEWTASGLLSETEVETRKVTWWGCYVVDKLFSLCLGRPSSTPKSSITCPKPSIDNDEEFAPWTPTSGPPARAGAPLGAHSHISSTAHHVSETFTIACEAMDVIYAVRNKLTPREIEDIVSKTDVELRSHYRALPSYLRLPASPKVPMLPHICLFHVQYHAHLILLHKPLMKKRRRTRRSISRSASTDDAAADDQDEYANEHMETCRYSAAEIARLLRIYKQQYTLRRIPIAAVHLCFSAVVIHLIDARPSNPRRHLAIHHLQTCIDALRDLRTAWCAWSDRALRAAQLLAREWYQCDDVAQLAAAGRATPPAVVEEVSMGGVGQFGPPLPGGAGVGAGEVVGREAEADPLAFLFDAATPDQFTDDVIREWLAESGYDDVLNMAT